MTAPEQPTPEASQLVEEIREYTLDRGYLGGFTFDLSYDGAALKIDRFAAQRAAEAVERERRKWEQGWCEKHQCYHRTKSLYRQCPDDWPDEPPIKYRAATPPPGDAGERAREMVTKFCKRPGCSFATDITDFVQSERTAARTDGAEAMREACAAAIRKMRGGWPTGAGDSDEWTLDDVADELLRVLPLPAPKEDER